MACCTVPLETFCAVVDVVTALLSKELLETVCCAGLTCRILVGGGFVEDGFVDDGFVDGGFGVVAFDGGGVGVVRTISFSGASQDG
jgi:hypothetical protein